MRTVVVNVVTRLTITLDEDVEVDEVINELEYSFEDTTGKAEITGSEIVYHNIKDD